MVSGFEAQPSPLSRDLPSWQAREGEVHVELRDSRGQRLTPVVTGSWGGLALDPYVHDVGFESRVRWVLDPFAFLTRALDLEPIPAPDFTTESGRRLLFVHIDGDSFVSQAEMPGRRYAGEVVLREFLRRYDLPTTVSIVEYDTSPEGKYKDQSPKLESIAKAIFKLPHVEVASHTFSHPFSWARAAKGERTRSADSADPVGLDVPGYRYSANREVGGSVRYINERLAPKEKPVSMFLWSGDALPGPDAMREVATLKIANMNGNNAENPRELPTLSQVPSLGRYVDGLLHVYGQAHNENVYTTEWTSRFYGFRDVIDGFRFSEAPRRLKPINIYYHFYSATKPAGITALHEVYKYALEQESLPIYASEMVSKAEDFHRVTFARRIDGAWELRGLGTLRTLRLDRRLGWPDLNNSNGVAGVTDSGPGRYVALSGEPEVTPGPHLGQTGHPAPGFGERPGGLLESHRDAGRFPAARAPSGPGHHRRLHLGRRRERSESGAGRPAPPDRSPLVSLHRHPRGLADMPLIAGVDLGRRRGPFLSWVELLALAGMVSSLLVLLFPGSDFENPVHLARPDDLSIAYLRMLLRAHPEDAEARLLLVQQQKALGRLEDAHESLAMLHPRSPDMEARAEVVALSLDRIRLAALNTDDPGRPLLLRETHAAARRLINRTNKPAEIADLADFLLQVGDPAEAARAYRRLATLDRPNHIAWLEKAARWSEAAGQPGVAARIYAEASLAASPAAPPAEAAGQKPATPPTKELQTGPRLGRLALRALMAANEGKPGLEVARPIVERFPDDLELLELAVRMAVASGDLAIARRWGEQRVIVAGSSDEALREQADILMKGGDPEGALRVAKVQLERAPDDVALRRQVAQLARWSGNAEEALEQYSWLARRGFEDARTKSLELARGLADGNREIEMLELSLRRVRRMAPPPMLDPSGASVGRPRPRRPAAMSRSAARASLPGGGLPARRRPLSDAAFSVSAASPRPRRKRRRPRSRRKRRRAPPRTAKRSAPRRSAAARTRRRRRRAGHAHHGGKAGAPDLTRRPAPHRADGSGRRARGEGPARAGHQGARFVPVQLRRPARILEPARSPLRKHRPARASPGLPRAAEPAQGHEPRRQRPAGAAALATAASGGGLDPTGGSARAGA